MGEPRIIGGCSVLKAAPAREHSRYEVVICQLPDVKEGEQPRTRSATTGVPRYVVWYIDNKGNPTDGRYYKEREAGHAEFERRTQSIPL